MRSPLNTVITHAVMLCTAPVLVLQGKRVRRMALILPEPEGARAGTIDSNPSLPALRLLVLGDSAAAGVGCLQQNHALASQLAAHLSAVSGRSVTWQLIAKSELTCREIIGYLVTHKKEPFDIAVISMGVNDVTAMVGLKECISKRQALLEVLQSQFSVKHLVHSALPPVGKFPLLPQPLRWAMGRKAQALDEALLRWAANQSAVSVCKAIQPNGVDIPKGDSIADWMAHDGFHPGTKAYKLWADQLAEHIHQQVLPHIQL